VKYKFQWIPFPRECHSVSHAWELGYNFNATKQCERTGCRAIHIAVDSVMAIRSGRHCVAEGLMLKVKEEAQIEVPCNGRRPFPHRAMARETIETDCDSRGHVPSTMGTST